MFIGNGNAIASTLSFDKKKLVCIPDTTELILRGKLFTVQQIFTIGASSSRYINCDPTVLVPDLPTFEGKVVAYPLSFLARGGESDAKIWIGGDYSGGTDAIVNNRNGLSSNVNQMTCKIDPTGSNKGTMKFEYITGSSSQAFITGGGENREDYPIILNNTVKYLLELNNTNGVPIDIEVRFNFAEF